MSSRHKSPSPCRSPGRDLNKFECSPVIFTQYRISFFDVWSNLRASCQICTPFLNLALHGQHHLTIDEQEDILQGGHCIWRSCKYFLRCGPEKPWRFLPILVWLLTYSKLITRFRNKTSKRQLIEIYMLDGKCFVL